MSDNQSPKVFVATFGCQMNEYDSDRVIRLMAGHGFRPTGELEQADLIFLNTCSIRDKAEQKVYSYLGRLAPLKEKKPGLVIGVGGCVAQQQGKSLFGRVPHLDLVLGTHGINHLPALVSEVMRTGRKVAHLDFDYDLSRPHVPYIGEAGRPVSAFLTIMQGCDNYCAYCVVPYVRGREVSRAPEDILAEAEELISCGAGELTLLGQNVNSYGRGLDGGPTFARLLRQVAELPGLLRLRFTTSHPKDLSPELIDALAEVPPLAEHVHLPVQSGSNRILKAMGRGYTREEYLDLVQAVRRACPDVALTTDIIVGFPGETDQDFEDTMDLVERVGYDGMYSFKYSDRPLTRAARLPKKVDEEVKGARLARLQARQKEITLACNQRLVGRRAEVLVEGRSQRRPGQLTGRTRGHKIVNFDGPAELIGCLAEPLVVEAWANSLKGELAEND